MTNSGFLRGVIFVQPILYNFCDNYFFPFFIEQKQRREKKIERIKTHVNMRKIVVSKVVKT